MTTSSSPTRAERRQEKRSNPGRIGFGRVLAWSSSHASQACNFVLLTYFTIYATDTLELAPAIVGAVILISKILDAVGAVVAGYLVDRARTTRFGKARPFDLAIVGIWVFTAILFATPSSLGEVGKYIWVFVGYLIINAIFTPLFLANQPLYLARAFTHREAITKATTSAGIVIGVLSLIVGISVPIFVQIAGKSPSAWATLALAYAIPLTIFGLLRFFFIKEKVETEPALERATFRDIRKVLSTNPYLWAVAGMSLVVAVVGNLGALTYYFRYIVGNVALQGIFGAFSILVVPIFLVFPALIRRFSVSKLIAAAGAVGVVGFLVYLIAGANIPLLVVAALLTAISALPTSFLLPILIVDNSTFNEWKGNRRLESIGGGIAGLASNIGSGIAAGILGLVLGLAGYDGAKSTQAPSAISGIVALTSIVPAVLSVAVIIIAIRYNRFEKRLPSITSEIDIRRAAAAAGGVAPTASSSTTALDNSEVHGVPDRDSLT